METNGRTDGQTDGQTKGQTNDNDCFLPGGWACNHSVAQWCLHCCKGDQLSNLFPYGEVALKPATYGSTLSADTVNHRFWQADIMVRHEER